MGQRILALELSGDHVRAALADRTYKTYDLVGVFAQRRAADETDLGSAIARVIAAAGQPDITLSALPGEFVAKRLLALPFTDRRRLLQVVPFALEEHLPFAVDDAIVAFARVGRVDSSTLVIAASARREELRRHLGLLAGAGLDPKTVTLSTHALAGLLGRVRGGRDSAHLMLEIGETVTSMVLIDAAGAPRAMRTVGQGLDLRGNPGAAQTSATAILAAVRQTLLAHSGDQPAPDLIVAGAATADPAIRRELSTTLNVTVRDLAEFDCSPLIRGVKAEASGYAGCLAMLAGEAPDAPLELLNFRQGEFAFHGPMGALGPWRTTVKIGAGMVGLVLLHVILSMAVNARELHLLNTAIRTTVTPALGEASPATARAALQAKLAAMNKQLRLFGGDLGHGSPLDVLLQLSRAIPPSVLLQASSLVIDEGSLKLEGSADSFATVDQIKRALERGGGFGAIQVEHAGAGTDSSKVEFRLSAKLRDAAGGS